MKIKTRIELILLPIALVLGILGCIFSAYAEINYYNAAKAARGSVGTDHAIYEAYIAHGFNPDVDWTFETVRLDDKQYAAWHKLWD